MAILEMLIQDIQHIQSFGGFMNGTGISSTSPRTGTPKTPASRTHVAVHVSSVGAGLAGSPGVVMAGDSPRRLTNKIYNPAPLVVREAPSLYPTQEKSPPEVNTVVDVNAEISGDSLTESWSKQLEEILQSLTDLAIEAGLDAARSKLDAMVNVFSSNIPAPRYTMREAKMIAKAQEKVIASTQWVTASVIAQLAQFKSANTSSAASKWKTSCKIFSVNYLSEELYPIYTLDKSNGFRPLEGLKPIIELFRGRKDSWGMAYWFAGANGFLNGRRPQDVLEHEPELVLKAAEDELKGFTHG
jgi:hypothetical protein